MPPPSLRAYASLATFMVRFTDEFPRGFLRYSENAEAARLVDHEESIHQDQSVNKAKKALTSSK